MGSIIWNNKTVLEFDDVDKDFFIASCNVEGIKYNTDNESIVLFPALVDKTFILKSTIQQEELRGFIKSVEKSLKSEGAAVILDEGFIDKTTLEYFDAQAIIVFSIVEETTDLTVYLPFNIEKTSISITKNLLKHLNLLETRINYKIANSWNKICAAKYWTYIFSNAVPTLVFEIPKSTLSDSFFTSFRDVLVKSIIEELGYKPTKEQARYISKFLDALKEKNSYKDIMLGEDSNLEVITSKLECCQMELEELKHSYKQTEEELQKFKDITEEDYVEKSSNSETGNEKKKKNLRNYKVQKNQMKSTDKSKGSRSIIYKKKNIEGQSKTKVIPIFFREDDNQEYYYQQLSYPLKYPGEGPVHQFERPRPYISKPVLPPSNIIQNKTSSNKLENNKDYTEVDNVYNLMYPK